MDNRYRTNKYPAAAEHVHKLVQEGFVDLTIGMVEQQGKFGLVMFYSGQIAEIMHMDYDADRPPRAAIVEEMATGFVNVTFFTDLNKLWAVWGEIESDYDRYFAG